MSRSKDLLARWAKKEFHHNNPRPKFKSLGYILPEHFT
jgi:hypothetical protein